MRLEICNHQEMNVCKLRDAVFKMTMQRIDMVGTGANRQQENCAINSCYLIVAVGTFERFVLCIPVHKG